MAKPLWPKCLHCKEYLDAGASKKLQGFCSQECKNKWRTERGMPVNEGP